MEYEHRITVDIYAEKEVRGFSREYFVQRLIEKGLRNKARVGDLKYTHQSSGGRACWRLTIYVISKSTDEAKATALLIAHGFGVNQAYVRDTLVLRPVEPPNKHIEISVYSKLPLNELEEQVDYEIEVCPHVLGAHINLAQPYRTGSRMNLDIAYTGMDDASIERNFRTFFSRATWIASWTCRVRETGYHIAETREVIPQISEQPTVKRTMSMGRDTVTLAEAVLADNDVDTLVRIVNDALDIDLFSEWYNEDSIMQIIALIASEVFASENDALALYDTLALYKPLCEGMFFFQDGDEGLVTIRKIYANGRVGVDYRTVCGEYTYNLVFASELDTRKYLKERGYYEKPNKNTNL